MNSKLEINKTKKNQFILLKKLLKNVLPSNKFYLKKLGSVGITSYKDIKNWEDFKRIPFTVKDELRRDQRNFPLLGSNISKPMADYVYLTYTSGTSGSGRFYTAYSAEDFARAIEQEIIWFNLIGVTAKDRLMFILPFALTKLLSDASIKIGAMLLPADGISQYDLIKNMVEVKPTVVETSPTVIINMINLAKEERINLKKIGIEKLILTGEPGIDKIRKDVETAFGCNCYDALGSTELSIYSFDCLKKKGPHLIENNTIFEVVDPITGVASETGKGELVATSLWRQSFPFIRYKTGDYVNLVSKKCGCGWSGKTLEGGILRRIDSIVKINGIDHSPARIEEGIRKIIGSNEFVIALKKKNKLDEIYLYIEWSLLSRFKNYKKIQTTIVNMTGTYPKVVIIPPNTIKKSLWKTKRFYDLRKENHPLDFNPNMFIIYSKLFRLISVSRNIYERIF